VSLPVDLELLVDIHRGRLGPREYRVIRARPQQLAQAVLLQESWYFEIFADAPAAEALAAAWMLAAESRHSLVWLPLRPGAPVPDGEPGGRPLDLLLVHHSLQFPASRWKALRARLGPGRPQRVEVSRSSIRLPDHDAYARRHHREYRDHLTEHVAADTLLLTGSDRAFREAAPLFLDVAENGPTYTPRRRGDHYCAELRPQDGTIRGGAALHIAYPPTHALGEGGAP